MDSKIDASIAKLKDTTRKPSAETLERMLMDIGYLKGSLIHMRRQRKESRII